MILRMTKNTDLNQVYIRTEGPWSGFEPEPRDPQSRMLPGYTTTAIMFLSSHL